MGLRISGYDEDGNPQYEWINLQVDCTLEEEEELSAAGVTTYPGSISSFADTAALMMHLDVVITVDTAIAHLAGALGRPTWIGLNWFATDWRWLLDRNDCPWYPTMRLFRQKQRDHWQDVFLQMEAELKQEAHEVIVGEILPRHDGRRTHPDDGIHGSIHT